MEEPVVTTSHKGLRGSLDPSLLTGGTRPSEHRPSQVRRGPLGFLSDTTFIFSTEKFTRSSRFVYRDFVNPSLDEGHDGDGTNLNVEDYFVLTYRPLSPRVRRSS